ncbi:MAG: hypothetical protein PSV22_18590 [Pseudolabrys sp.]|nr:hypothetical protein [Pseudolabrys sp.]
MSVITHGQFVNSSDPAKSPATSSDLAFARQSADRHFWRRARALVCRAYGPLIVYAILSIALVAIVALRVAIWVPLHWH